MQRVLVKLVYSWESPLSEFFKKVWHLPNFLFLNLQKSKTFATLFLLLTLNACYNQKKNNLSALQLLLNGWMNQTLFFYSNSSVKGQGAVHEENLSRILDVAQKSLYCSFYDVNLVGVIDKLKLAKQRNVKIRVAIDEDNLNGIGYIELSKFLVTFGEERELWIGNRGAGQNYFHGCVSDNNRAYIMTAPPTLQGLYYSSAIGVYVQSHEDGIIRKFSSALELLNNGAFGSSRQRLDQRNYWLINSQNIGVYLAPEENPIDFLEKRVGGAKDSLHVYTSEFLSNKTKDEIRTLGDIAYEIRYASTPIKQIVGSWHAHMKSDEKSFGDCSWNIHFGVACDPNKSESEKADAPRRINSLQYLRNNQIPSLMNANEWFSNSLNLFFIDINTPSPLAFVSSAPFSNRADSSHDGVVFLLEYRSTVDPIFQFYLSLLEKSRSFENITKEAKELDVVISELNWAGGINRQKKREASEYIELYNNRDYPINLENWKFECGSNQNFNQVINFPKNTIIGSNSYLLIADEKTTILQDVALKRNFGGFDLISDANTEQCRLLSANGDIIDIIGVVGTKLSAQPLKLGMLDIDNNVIRSMERIHLTQRGDTLENWHTNSHSEIRSNINFHKDFIYYTFGTPGYENSANIPVPVLPPSKARSLVINEIGVNYPNTNDRWVEIYNPLNEPLNLNELSVFLVRDSGCTLDGSSHTGKMRLTGIIPANGYYLVVREDSPNFVSLADQTSKTSGDIGTLAGNCIFLSIGDSPITSPESSNVIDFVNIGGSGALENNSFISSSAGFYSRCPNGTDTNINANDFKNRPRTPKTENLCSNPSLVINEIGRQTGGSDNSWIELYNPSSQSIDLSLWEIYLKRDSGCTLTGGSHTAQVALTGLIPPGGYYLIVRDSATPAFTSIANILTVSSGTQPILQNPDGNCFFLTLGDINVSASNPNPLPENVLDFVNINATGGGSYQENSTVLSTLSSGSSYSRCTNGVDTNVNTNDFKIRPRTPKSGNSCINPTLVINEIGRLNPSANDTYLEIYNPTSNNINLSDMEIYLTRDSGCTLTGGAHTSYIPLTGIIPADGYYLVARLGTTTYGSADLIHADITSDPSGNCYFLTVGNVTITTPSHPNVLDFVNIGGSGDLENSSFVPSISSGQSYSRCANGIDTNYNGNDFKLKPRTAKLENICYEPVLKINEIGRITPSTNDTWIEIYNPTPYHINLSDWSIHLIRDSGCTLNGSPHTASIPLTGSISANGYYLIARNTTTTFSATADLLSADVTADPSNNCYALTLGNIILNVSNPNPLPNTVLDFVNINATGVGSYQENSSFLPALSSGSAYSRCPNAQDTNVNASDFIVRPQTAKVGNNCP